MTWIPSKHFAILCFRLTLPNANVMSEPSHWKTVLTIPIEVRRVFWIHGKQAVVPMLQSLSHDAVFPFSLVNFKRCGGAPLGCTEVGMPSFKALIQAICLLSLAFSGTGQSSCRYRCSIKSFSFRLFSPSSPWPQLKLHHILASVLACMLITFRTRFPKDEHCNSHIFYILTFCLFGIWYYIIMIDGCQVSFGFPHQQYPLSTAQSTNPLPIVSWMAGQQIKPRYRQFLHRVTTTASTVPNLAHQFTIVLPR